MCPSAEHPSRGQRLPHLKQTPVPLPSLEPVEVTTCFYPCSLQLRSRRQFAFLHLPSCHWRVLLPALCHRATLRKMPRAYSAFVIISARRFRSPLSHLLPFHCQKTKQLVKIQNSFTAVCSHFALTHLVLFYCLQTLVQSNCTRRSTHRKERKCKIMFSDHFCYFQSNLLAQIGKYLAIFLQWLSIHAI